MWVVLVDTGCEDPDVIGPFSDHEEANKVMLDAAYYYGAAWIQTIFTTLGELTDTEEDWEC